MKSILTVALWAFSIYAIYCAALFLFQRRLMFPRHIVSSPPESGPLSDDVEKMRIPVSGGNIEAWFLPPRITTPGKSAPIIIYAHGNAETIDDWPGVFNWFPEKGVGVLLVEYPGYGRSRGAPSQESITEAFTAAYDAIIQRGEVDKDRIILFGRSIGGGAVCALARKRTTAAMVLMSAFTSARFFASAYFAPGFLVLDAFDNLSVIEDYPNPVLVIHGRNDEIIPYSHGISLAQAADKGRLISYPSGHNDCPPDWRKLREEIMLFLSETGVIAAPV